MIGLNVLPETGHERQAKRWSELGLVRHCHLQMGIMRNALHRTVLRDSHSHRPQRWPEHREGNLSRMQAGLALDGLVDSKQRLPSWGNNKFVSRAIPNV